MNETNLGKQNFTHVFCSIGEAAAKANRERDEENQNQVTTSRRSSRKRKTNLPARAATKKLSVNCMMYGGISIIETSE
jgi:hypothetical protein